MRTEHVISHDKSGFGENYYLTEGGEGFSSFKGRKGIYLKMLWFDGSFIPLLSSRVR